MECYLSLMTQLLSSIVPTELIPTWIYRMITDRQYFPRFFTMYHLMCSMLHLPFLPEPVHIWGLALLIILSDLSAFLQLHHLDDVIMV